MPKPKQRTKQDQRQLIEKIDQARQKGLTVKEASKTVGLAESLYYIWKKKLDSQQQPQLVQIEYNDSSDQVFIVSGKAKDILAILEKINRMER